MTKTKRRVLGFVVLLAIGNAANAALLSRFSGQAYYDTTLNITWLANTNAGAGTIYDRQDGSSDGRLDWQSAQDWVASLNTAGHLGANNWRLPWMTDVGALGCTLHSSGLGFVGGLGTDCNYNLDIANGEMANLFYGTLGNTAYIDTNGNFTGCIALPDDCLQNRGPFTNFYPGVYWYGRTYGDGSGPTAWIFNFSDGAQTYSNKSAFAYAWAVRDGDISAVPAPGVAWLLAGAFALLGRYAGRRR